MMCTSVFAVGKCASTTSNQFAVSFGNQPRWLPQPAQRSFAACSWPAYTTAKFVQHPFLRSAFRSSLRRSPCSGDASVSSDGHCCSRSLRTWRIRETRAALRPPRSRLASAGPHLRADKIVGVNQRLAPAGTSTGPCLAKPVRDHFQVAHLKTHEVALKHADPPRVPSPACARVLLLPSAPARARRRSAGPAACAGRRAGPA